MTLSKQGFEKAKQNAFYRLTGWATDEKSKRDGGIPRLQEGFKHAFKKIEWKKGKAAKQEEKDKKKLTTKKEPRLSKPKTKPPASTEPLTDSRRHNSNSSNVSSRLGTAEISDNIPRTTPGPVKSFTPADALHKALKESLYDELEKEAARQEEKAKESTSEKLFNEFRRKKTRKKKKKDVAQPAADKEGTMQTWCMNVDTAHEEEVKSSPAPSHISFSRKSSTSRTRNLSISTKVGVVDVVLKRNLKQARLRIEESNEALARNSQTKLCSEERRKAALTRFRRLVRLLIHIRVLLNVARFKIEAEEKVKLKGFKTDGGRELTFDATMFKTAMTSYGGLTSRARKALKKNPADRNEDDAKILMEIMLRLPLFAKYPKNVKQDLAKMLWYDRFREGRVIVKQGDPGTRMYFIVSGPGVSLRRTDKWDREGAPVSYQYRTVGAGSTFGELALIREVKRDYTAVCTGTSEFLSLSKTEFNTVLRNRWEKEYIMRYDFLQTSQYFRTWAEQQLQACADYSELKEYSNNTVIIGNISELPDSVYFIRRGRCEIVRRIMVVKHKSPYLQTTVLLPSMARQRPDFLNKPYGHRLRSMREEYVYLTVRTLESGSYFGAGEDLTDTYIVAKGKTECVVVNSAQFSIQGKSELLRNLKNKFEKILPTNSVLYRKYQINRKWFAYRQKLLNEIVSRRKCYVTLNDVPLSVRNEPTIHLNM